MPPFFSSHGVLKLLAHVCDMAQLLAFHKSFSSMHDHVATNPFQVQFTCMYYYLREYFENEFYYNLLIMHE